MGREGILAIVGKVLCSGYHLTVECGDHDIIIVGGYFKGVGSRGDLASRLGDRHGHIVGTFARGRPSGVPIAVVRVVRIVGLQEQLLSIDIAFHLFKLKDGAMFNVSTQHHHDGVLEVGHIHFGAFVRSTDGDIRCIIFGVDHIERTGYRRSGLPAGAITRLCGTHFHETLFTRKGKDVAVQSGGALDDFKGHRKSRSGRGLQRNRFVVNQLVGDFDKIDELCRQATRNITNG